MKREKKKILSMKEPQQTQHLICCWSDCCIGINTMAECLYIYFMLDDPVFLRVGLAVFLVMMAYIIFSNMAFSKWQSFNPYERYYKTAYISLAVILVITALCSIQFFIFFQHPLSWIIPLTLVLLEALVAVCIHHRYSIYRYFKSKNK